MAEPRKPRDWVGYWVFACTGLRGGLQSQSHSQRQALSAEELAAELHSASMYPTDEGRVWVEDTLCIESATKLVELAERIAAVELLLEDFKRRGWIGPMSDFVAQVSSALKGKT